MFFMKRIRFLVDMRREGKLEMIEPSEEVCWSYLAKADSHFESAKILLAAGKLEESVSLAYYGMYHSLLALLFKCGIKSENHSASIMLLKELFGEGELEKEISFGKRERIDKQYYVDFSVTRVDVEEMVVKAESFISKIKVVIRRITGQKVNEFRKELEEALKSKT